jgi:predicted  nucleic acid-binding Zn-ribbon protein
MEEYFLSLRKFKEQIQIIDLEKKFNELQNNNNNLSSLNMELEKKVKELDTKVKDLDIKVKERDEEIASFKKNSILSAMSKQIEELKNYIIILEKQMKNYKSKNEIIEEYNKDNNTDTKDNNIDTKDNNIDINKEIAQIKEENEEKEQEYETIEYKGKFYYKIKKRIYRINKDKTLGNLFGRIKNGEIIRDLE